MRTGRVVDLAELDVIQAAAANEVERIDALSEVYIEMPVAFRYLLSLDPFSPAFVQGVTGWLEHLSGRANYDPARDELANYLEKLDGEVAFVPSIYRLGSSKFLGEMMQSFGGVLKALDVRAGQSVLEYGPGDGQISLMLARIGCHVTAVDIEQRYLDHIVVQAKALGTQVHVTAGPFGTSASGASYDRILFFEAFHHSLGHHALVHALHDQLALGGAVVFAGEPILATNNHYRCTLPYAWGPRLDGLSLQAMRNHGWCELGFTREYFVEMLMRGGFSVNFIDNATTSRGAAFIARPTGAGLDLGGPVLVEAVGMPDCWHPGEGGYRFMRSPLAGIPVDGHGGWASLTLELQQHLPVNGDLKLSLGTWESRIVIPPGETRSVRMPVPTGGGVLRVEGAVHRPSDLSAVSADHRTLGVAAIRLSYFR